VLILNYFQTEIKWVVEALKYPILIYLRNNNKTMVFLLNLISSSYLVVQVVEKAHRHKTSLEIIDSYISQQAIYSENKDKKVDKMHK